MVDPGPSRCGYVAVLGAPNSGKSTLVNSLVGSKVSIVTPKVQTTRTRVLGIALKGPSQIVYVDTPGIFAPKRRLERAMVKAAWQGAADADEIVVLVDAAAAGAHGTVGHDTVLILEGLKGAGRSAILVLNKIDLVDKGRLLGLSQALNRGGTFSATFMISALNGEGVADLERHLAALMPEGPWLYPEDQLADIPLRLMAAETTRETLFLALHQELPYAATVETEGWEEFRDGSVKIAQVIYVQRDSQKAIVLGKGGRQIKAIRESSSAELEQLLGRRVHLFLFVKVREDWTEDPERYRAIGLDYER